MINENEYCFKVTETDFNNSLLISKKDHKDFKNSAKCWICKKVYQKYESKVKNHDHITKNYPEYAHQEFNINIV